MVDPPARIESVQSLVGDHIQRLDDMFDDPDLETLRAKTSNHPAVKQRGLLLTLGESDKAQVSWPEEGPLTNALGNIGLDFTTWAPSPPYPTFWSFLDEKTSRWTRNAIRSADQYQDVIAELFVAGWLDGQGFTAIRKDEDGMPDIRLGVHGAWPCEVKQIHYGTRPDRIVSVIKKGNRQIKAMSPDGSGTIFVGIERDPTRQAFDDRLPNDVSAYVEEAHRALHPGKLRSVAQVVLYWDDVMILGDPPGKVMYTFRRRSTVLTHPSPRVQSPYPAETFAIGRTLVLPINFPDAPRPAESPTLKPLQSAGHVRVSQLFRQQNEFNDGVRSTHAIEAVAEHDGRAELGSGETTILLFTRGIQQLDKPYTLLVVATQPSDSTSIEVIGGYRLYVLPPELVKDPKAVFDLFLERYGVDVTIEDVTRRFIPYHSATKGATIRADDQDRDFQLSSFVKVGVDGAMEFGCVFALDMSKYRDALRRKRS